MKRKHGAIVLALVTVMSFMGLQGASATSVRSLNENSANKIYAVKIGSELTLTLHSMYWSLTPLTPGSGIAPVGTVISKPILPGPNAPAGCGLPGMGCGTQTWKFIAKKSGTFTINASRTSCGEALQCTGPQGSYSVTIKVKK